MKCYRRRSGGGEQRTHVRVRQDRERALRLDPRTARGLVPGDTGDDQPQELAPAAVGLLRARPAVAAELADHIASRDTKTAIAGGLRAQFPYSRVVAKTLTALAAPNTRRRIGRHLPTQIERHARA
jgi:hypothetical protein